MTYITSFLTALLSMVAIDAVWLTAMKPFYMSRIGHLLADGPNMVPGALLYMLYAIGLTVLIVLPALTYNYSITKVFALGLLFGLVAYGAYDLTNHTTMRDWPLAMTIVDMAWGAVLTGVVVSIATYATKLFG